MIKNTVANFTTGMVSLGLSKATSKVTEKVFNKADTYSRYQHYYRSKGKNYSQSEVYKKMYRNNKIKTIVDRSLDYTYSFIQSLSLKIFGEM